MAGKKINTNKFTRDFVCEDGREYKARLGSTIASSLAGMVCGVIIASIIWFVAFNYIITALGITCT